MSKRSLMSKIFGIVVVFVLLGTTLGGLIQIASAAKFNIGDTVEVYNTGSSGLVVRDTSCGNQIGGKFDGALGTVLDGPVFCDNYNRWKIRWLSDGLVGWSAEDWLRKVSQPPSPPSLVSPSNGATGVSLTPTFQWNSVANADYYGLYISEPPYGPSHLVYDNDGPIYGTSLTLPGGKLSPGVKYCWNMRAHNSAGWGGFSSAWYFTTEPAPLSPPSLVSPPNGATGISLTPTFRWNSVANADYYGLYISEPPYGPSHLVYDNNGPVYGTSLTLPSGKLSPGVKYCWNMRAYNSAGWGGFSSAWYFTTEPAPNQAPTCSLSATPTSGSVPLTITFTMSANDPDGSISVWGLDVNGDGSAEYSGAGNPPSTQTHTYTTPGTYIAALAVLDNEGAGGWKTVTIVAGENKLPTCSLLPDKSSGKAPLTVTFSISASDSDGWISSWELLPGDGSPAYSGTGNPPSTKAHTYTTAGTYTAILGVTDNEGATRFDNKVINVAPLNLPAIARSPSSFSFTTTETGANPSSQPLSIWNSGGGTLSWSVSDDATWLSLSPTSGSSTGETDGVMVSVDTSGMSAGSYKSNITILASGAINTPQAVPVALTIKPASGDTTPPNTQITDGPSGTIDYNDVTFTWTGSDDVTPTSELVYSYYLDGYDSDWSGWVSDTSRSYNDLTNGDYAFRVKARDQSGNIDATPAERSFAALVAYELKLSIPVYAPQRQIAHKGTTLTYLIEVINEEDTTGTISLSVSDKFGWNTQLSKSWLTLASGKSAEIYLNITLGGNHYSELDEITINALSQGDPTKISSCHVFASCRNDEDGLLAASIQFSNPDIKGHTLSFSALDYVKISDESIALAPSESRWIDVVFDPKPAQVDLDAIYIEVTDITTGETVKVPVRFKVDEVIATYFDIAKNSYNFRNPLGLFCYGMSETSVLHFKNEIALPNNKPNTYSLTELEAMSQIVYHQRFFTKSFVESVKLKLMDIDQEKEYSNLEANIRKGNPMLLLMDGGGVFGGHTVVAYKIIKEGDKAYILVYDSEIPYGMGGSSFRLAFSHATYNLTSGTFNYLGFYKFVTLEAEKLPLDEIPVIFIIACPVNATVTDEYGNAITDNGLNQIPNADMVSINETKIFYLPPNLKYRVDIESYGIGILDFTRISLFGNNLSVTKFENVQTGPNTTAFAEIEPSATNYTLRLDYDGDGNIDEEKTLDVDELIKIEVSGDMSQGAGDDGTGNEEKGEEIDEEEASLPAPANFVLGSLTISPTEVKIGEMVEISILVTNTGGESGSYEVVLKINGGVEATKVVTIVPAQSKSVSFTTSRDIAGRYLVEVNGISGFFTVKEPVTKTGGFNWSRLGGIIAAFVIAFIIVCSMAGGQGNKP